MSELLRYCTVERINSWLLAKAAIEMEIKLLFNPSESQGLTDTGYI